jgi:hypothetical protein
VGLLTAIFTLWEPAPFFSVHLLEWLFVISAPMSEGFVR